MAADDNGAGKSTVAEALRWCLYGETVRGEIDKSLSVDHVMREGSKKTEVIVEFLYGAILVIVERKRTKTKGEFSVKIGASTVHKGDVAREVLDNMLGVNVLQFANLVHLDGSYPYLFAPSSDRDRKEILADLVDVAITELMQAEVKTRLGPIEAELGSLKESYIREETLRGHHKTKVDEYRVEGQLTKKRLSVLNDTLQGYKDTVSEYSTEKQLLEEENEERTVKYALEIATKMAEHAEMSGMVELKWKEKSEVSASYLQSELAEVNKALYSKKSRAKSIAMRIVDIKELQAEGKCGTCGQDTTDVQTHELESFTSQAEGIEREIEGDSATLKGIEAQRSKKLEDLLDSVKTFDQARDRCQSQLEELQRADKDYRGRVLGDLKKVTKFFDEATSNLVDHVSKTYSTKKLFKRIKHEYKTSKDMLQTIDIEVKELKKRKIQLDAEVEKLEFWKKGFGPKGVSSLFIETVLPHISAHIQKYANILTGGDIVVSLQAYKETKSKTIREAIQISAVNSKGASVYGSNSTGERNRINLAVTLGLITYFREANVFESNLLVCDEIFDGLDATGVERALRALAEAEVESVLIMSHHSHLKPLFDDVIYVVKENGVSEIVQ
jgi:DNA repair exonuclease SbcCD ATPase subunit